MVTGSTKNVNAIKSFIIPIKCNIYLYILAPGSKIIIIRAIIYYINSGVGIYHYINFYFINNLYYIRRIFQEIVLVKGLSKIKEYKDRKKQSCQLCHKLIDLTLNLNYSFITIILHKYCAILHLFKEYFN